ncbi:hypothetical protein AB0R12_17575, partial [Streptomyces niveus]
MEREPPWRGRGATGVVRSVERKALNGWSLLHTGLLWGNSPALSPVRADLVAGRRPGTDPPSGGTVGGMDTTWWVALIVVVVLALVATLVDGRGRSPRPPGDGHAPELIELSRVTEESMWAGIAAMRLGARL